MRVKKGSREYDGRFPIGLRIRQPANGTRIGNNHYSKMKRIKLSWMVIPILLFCFSCNKPNTLLTSEGQKLWFILEPDSNGMLKPILLCDMFYEDGSIENYYWSSPDSQVVALPPSDVHFGEKKWYWMGEDSLNLFELDYRIVTLTKDSLILEHGNRIRWYSSHPPEQ